MDKTGIVKKLWNNHILAEPLESDNVKHGLYAPKMQREERYEKLKVVQGDEEVFEGDTILVMYGKGTSYNTNDKDYVFVNKSTIIAVL